jgi:hypothetical protein
MPFSAARFSLAGALSQAQGQQVKVIQDIDQGVEYDLTIQTSALGRIHCDSFF